MRIILLLLLLGPQCWAQEPSQLFGSWIKTSTQNNDGKRYTESDDAHFSYAKLRINDSLVHIHTHPMYDYKGACYPFLYQDDKIYLSPDHYYEVVAISERQLTIRDHTHPDGKEILHTFEREEVLFDKINKQQSNSKYRLAMPGYTPVLNAPLEQLLDSSFNQMHENVQVKGTFMIDIPNQSVFTSISYSSTRDTDWLKYLKKTLDTSYKQWNITGFEKAKIIQIPFVLQDVKTPDYAGFTMAFLTESLGALHTPLIKQREWWSNEYFTLAIEAHQDKFKNRAIKLFDKCLELNPTNQHALFSRAKVYMEKGNEEEACRDWKLLLDQGYEAASQFLDSHCSDQTSLAESDETAQTEEAKAIL